jgi:uncharacterized protein YukJ
MTIKYGILRARVVKLLHHTPDDPRPHLEVLVSAGTADYRLAVNVRSDDETNLLFHVEPDFQNALLTAIDALPVGLTLPASDDHRVRLDYQRGDLFDTSDMKNVAPKAIGDPNQLDDLVSAALNAAMATEGGEVFAFGNPWRPENKPDEYFHFRPGQGVHDLHMNQGSPAPHAGDDGVWQDGGLFVRIPGAPTQAFFFAFQSQVWTTDDITGRPTD